MNSSNCPAAKLNEIERKELAIHALSGSSTISDLAVEHNVSRKFIYQQKNKASVALDDAFASTDADDEVLFMLPVTKAWLRQLAVALTLICHCSYRGVVELMRDLFGVKISEGTIHNIHQLVTERAKVHNQKQDLSPIRVGLQDEIFHCTQPVLAGIDAESTYCYLLAAEEHRDAETWGVHLLYANDQGFNPDYTIADQGTGLRAGQKLALGEKPCHGDVFHIIYQCKTLVNTLVKAAYGATAGSQPTEPIELAAQKQAQSLARDVGTLINWLSQDILSLAGPKLNIRMDLFDFIVAELFQREQDNLLRIRPVRIALQNQRDDLLAFAKVLDDKLITIAQTYQLSEHFVRQACLLSRKQNTSAAYWKEWDRLRTKMGTKFQNVFDAVAQVMAHTHRSSSLVENLNSRLRNYFTLRRQLGGSYLSLLQFFLNHRRFLRSRRPERVGKSPAQLMTGQDHPHWLTLLGLGMPQPLRG